MSTPKPLLLINNQTILEYVLEKIPVEHEIFVLTNETFFADFEDFAKKYPRKIIVENENSFDNASKIGALRAIGLFCEKYTIRENIAVLAGDNILTGFDFADLEMAEGAEKLAKILYRDIEEKQKARSFGVIELGEKNRVRSFEEKPASPKSSLISTGYMSFSAGVISQIINFSRENPDALGGIFPFLLEQGVQIIAKKSRGNWFDVGSFDSYMDAHKKLQKDDVKKGENAVLENCSLKGKVLVGANAVVRNSTLVDAIIYPNCVLENVHISHSIVGKNCALRDVDFNQKIIREKTKI